MDYFVFVFTEQRPLIAHSVRKTVNESLRSSIAEDFSSLNMAIPKQITQFHHSVRRCNESDTFLP